MQLAAYLQKKGIVSGALPPDKNTSVSGCGAIMVALKGQPPMTYGVVQNFGVSLHEQYLEKKKVVKVSKDEQLHIDNCLRVLDKNAFVRNLMKGSVSEQKLYRKLKGVLVAYILDIHQHDTRIGADLKTTSCSNLKQFIASAISYGYFRQAWTYIEAERLKLFFFIGISKNYRKPELFIFCANDFKDELKYAGNEMEFLLYFFKGYGKILPKVV